jgi:hypothetical protein
MLLTLLPVSLRVKVIAVAGGVELDPAYSPTAFGRSCFHPMTEIAAGPRAANMAFAALRSPLKTALPAETLLEAGAPEATADLRHLPAGVLPSKSGMDRGMPEAQGLRHRLSSLLAFEGCPCRCLGRDERAGMAGPGSAMLKSRAARAYVVHGGQGFRSTDLTDGKTSDEPADWIQKMIAGRAVEYRFAVEAAVELPGDDA